MTDATTETGEAGTTPEVGVVVGLACRRCNGRSVKPLDPINGFVESEVWACPHCFNDEQHRYVISEMYDVVGFKPVSAGLDAIDRFEELETELGPMSEVQYGDWKAIRVDGKSYRERGSERGVNPNAVHGNVRRATENMTKVTA